VLTSGKFTAISVRFVTAVYRAGFERVPDLTQLGGDFWEMGATDGTRSSEQ